MSLQNRKQELMGQIDRVMTACTITPDQVVNKDKKSLAWVKLYYNYYFIAN